MSSENKDYEMVAQNQEHSEADVIPQGIPVQNPYTPQYIHPQNQIITYPQQYQYAPQMMMVIPNQHIQQPIPQYMGGAHQFLPVMPPQIHEISPAQLTTKRQEHEQEIQKSKFAMALNWVMIFVNVVFSVSWILVSAHISDAGCYQSYWSYQLCTLIFTVTREILFVIIIILMMILLITLHYGAIVAYRKRNPRRMSCVFLPFAFLFGLQVLIFNVIGVLIYGYLAYWAYKMKTLFGEIEKIDKQISQQEARNIISVSTSQSDNQIQMSTF